MSPSKLVLIATTSVVGNTVRCCPVRIIVKSYVLFLMGGLPLALLLVGNFLRVQSYNGQPRRIRQAIERLRIVEMRLHLQEPQALVERSPSLADAPAISLHTLIAVSDQQLDERARTALYALSVFPPKPNTFSESAALTVCGGTDG